MSSAGSSCGMCSVHVQRWRFLWHVFCACPALAVLVACVLCVSSAGGSCGLCTVHVQRRRFLWPVFCACPAPAVLMASVLCMSSAGGSYGLCSVHVQRRRFLWPVFCACPALAVLVACVLCVSSAGGSYGLCSAHVQRRRFLWSVFRFFTYQVTVFLSPQWMVCSVVALLFFVLVLADRTIRVQHSLTVNKTAHSRKFKFIDRRNSPVHGK